MAKSELDNRKSCSQFQPNAASTSSEDGFSEELLFKTPIARRKLLQKNVEENEGDKNIFLDDIRKERLRKWFYLVDPERDESFRALCHGPVSRYDIKNRLNELSSTQMNKLTHLWKLSKQVSWRKIRKVCPTSEARRSYLLKLYDRKIAKKLRKQRLSGLNNNSERPPDKKIAILMRSEQLSSFITEKMPIPTKVAHGLSRMAGFRSGQDLNNYINANRDRFIALIAETE